MSARATRQHGDDSGHPRPVARRIAAVPELEAPLDRMAPFLVWPPPRGSFVYVIRLGEYVKIGFSTNVARRIGELECMAPETLVVLNFWPAGSFEEAALHRRFRKFRVKSEWFRLEGEVKDWIKAGCQPQHRAAFRASDVARAVKGARAAGASITDAGINDAGSIFLRIGEVALNNQHLYVARCCAFVKIGISGNVPYRIAGMQTGCPFPIELLHVFECRGDEEDGLHRRFARFRERGEWFFIAGEVKRWLDEGCPL